MKNAIRRLYAAACASLLLASCSGGGSSVSTLLPIQHPTTPAPVGQSSRTQANIVVRIGSNADQASAAIARHGMAANRRRPLYVSPSTIGLAVTVNPGGGTQAFDVSAGSPLCTAGSPRTCTLSIVAPVGSDTFTLTEYDQKPASGVIPGTAKQLATSSLTQTIVANAANSINFLISGIIAGATTSGGITYASLPSGAGKTYGIALVVTDADGNTITGSAAYNNPITATLTETGGSGFACVQVNGGTCSSSATVRYPSDSLALYYNGGGSVGYTTTTTIAASGATGTTLRVSPLYVTGSPYYTAASHSLAFTATTQTSNLGAYEQNAPANVAYTQSVAACGADMSASGGGSGGSAPVAVTANVAPYSSAGCQVNIYDNLGSTIQIPVTLPTPAQHCSNAALGVQLDNNTVSSGARCVLGLSPSAVTVYNPSDGSHPASANVTASEPYDTSTLSVTNNCGASATVTPSSIAGAPSATGTASGTITITANTSGSSCTVSVSDGVQAVQTIAVTLAAGIPTLPYRGNVTGTTQFGSVASGSANANSGWTNCTAGWDSCYSIVLPFTVSVAPTTAANALTVQIGGWTTSVSNGDTTGGFINYTEEYLYSCPDPSNRATWTLLRDSGNAGAWHMKPTYGGAGIPINGYTNAAATTGTYCLEVDAKSQPSSSETATFNFGYVVSQGSSLPASQPPQ